MVDLNLETDEENLVYRLRALLEINIMKEASIRKSGSKQDENKIGHAFQRRKIDMIYTFLRALFQSFYYEPSL